MEERRADAHSWVWQRCYKIKVPSRFYVESVKAVFQTQAGGSREPLELILIFLVGNSVEQLQSDAKHIRHKLEWPHGGVKWPHGHAERLESDAKQFKWNAKLPQTDAKQLRRVVQQPQSLLLCRLISVPRRPRGDRNPSVHPVTGDRWQVKLSDRFTTESKKITNKSPLTINVSI